MFLLLWISQAPTSTPTLLLGRTLTHPEHKKLTQQLQEQRTELSSRPELFNSPLITINLCLPGATRVADSTWHSVEAAVLRTAVTAFSLPPFFSVPAKYILMTHCKISCRDFHFFIKGTRVYFLQGFPFSPLQLHCGTVTAAPNPLHNRNCISLLTQCSDPMQTLAARRGTVGSVGRSLAHSLSTDTAYADCREEWERGGGNKKGWLDNAVESPCKILQWHVQRSAMEKRISCQQQVSNFIPTSTCRHMCTHTHTSTLFPRSEETCQGEALAVHFTRNSFLSYQCTGYFNSALPIHKNPAVVSPCI